MFRIRSRKLWPDPDPLVKGKVPIPDTDPYSDRDSDTTPDLDPTPHLDSDPDPHTSVIKQKK